MGKVLKPWEMRGVVISKYEVVLPVLKMVAIAKITDFVFFNKKRFIQLQ